MARALPGMRFGCVLIGTAALAGTLRFSGLYPLPPLHEFLSTLAAVSALPLIAITLAWPTSAVSATRRFAWVFFAGSAASGVLVVSVGGWRVAADICAVLSVLTLLAASLRRKEWLGVGAAVCLALAFAAFLAHLQIPDLLQPGDFLHIGLAAALLLLGRWASNRTQTPRVAPSEGTLHIAGNS
jgi:ascorbate-specific PTS system EIIC-type component UlaA